MWRLLEPETKRLPDLKWVRPDNWHITLKFLGDVSEEEVKKVRDSLKNLVGSVEAFDIRLGPLGAFPPKGSLRVLWIGLKDGISPMVNLSQLVEREMTSLGFKKEERQHTPHLTLARSRRGRPSRVTLEDFKIEEVELPHFRVNQLVLFESRLRPEGPEYHKLETFQLMGAK